MRRFFFLALVVLTLPFTAFATTLRISWDPVKEDNLLGYRVHWGFSSKQYTFHAEAGNNPYYEISDVRNGLRYYCAITAVDHWGNESLFSVEASAVIGDTSGHILLPQQWDLLCGYPNPFRSGEVSTIELAAPETAPFTLSVYNTLGQKVRTLYDGPGAAGRHVFIWDGRDDHQNPLPSSVYFYRFQTGWKYLTRTVSLIR